MRPGFTEESFVQKLTERFKVASPLLGIGDDCAIIPKDASMAWCVTTDALVEGVHFLPLTISARHLGYKSIAANASDIAAMGGKPLYAFLSLGIPKSCDSDFLDGFLDGIEEGLKEMGIKLLGGDTVGSLSHVFINITMVGEAALDKIKKRAMGKVGDFVCVDGYLGESAAGLDILLHDFEKTHDAAYASLLEAHRHPKAHVAEGEWLAQHTSVHAMMDLSDGLFTDLPRLLQASQCGATINLEQLPLSSSFKHYCNAKDKNPFRLAVEGGEEYCLLFTVAPSQASSLNEAFRSHFGRAFYPIGTLNSELSVTHYLLNGKPELLHAVPFQHFS